MEKNWERSTKVFDDGSVYPSDTTTQNWKIKHWSKYVPFHMEQNVGI
jgi:hypothetical protein